MTSKSTSPLIKKSEIIRISLPPDANMLVSTRDRRRFIEHEGVDPPEIRDWRW